MDVMPNNMVKNKRKTYKNIFHWLITGLIAILLAVILRVFVFALFAIPTPSMEPAIQVGDKVLVNKLIPGPRIIRNLFSLHQDGKANIKRLKGYRTIRRNDILIFNLAMDMNVFYAKRCVAIPGDTFFIKNGIYKVKNCDDILGNYESQRRFFQIEEQNMPPEVFRCFPYNPVYSWNVKNFGPIYIPGKGDTIRMDEKNRLLYGNLIQYETCREEIPDELPYYIFQQNYYFMAGDYVFDSKDSRYWGLLPEEHIIGKVSRIWNSKDLHTGKLRWNRFLKKVK